LNPEEDYEAVRVVGTKLTLCKRWDEKYVSSAKEPPEKNMAIDWATPRPAKIPI
jgi:hypothetical protein